MAKADETGFAKFVDSTVCVMTCDGRIIVGLLRGYDQNTNLILEDSHERVFSPTGGVQIVKLDLYLVRGDNVAVVGELDEELDAQQDLDSTHAPELKPIYH